MAPTVGNLVDKIIPSVVATPASNASSADWRVVVAGSLGFGFFVLACVYVARKFMQHRERLARKGNPGMDLRDAYIMDNKKYKRWERLRMIMPWLKKVADRPAVPIILESTSAGFQKVVVENVKLAGVENVAGFKLPNLAVVRLPPGTRLAASTAPPETPRPSLVDVLADKGKGKAE